MYSRTYSNPNNVIRNHLELFREFLLKPTARAANAPPRRRRLDERSNHHSDQSPEQAPEQLLAQRARIEDEPREVQLANIPYTSIRLNHDRSHAITHAFPGLFSHFLCKAMRELFAAELEPWGHCMCCSNYRPADNLVVVPNHQKERVMHEHGIPAETIRTTPIWHLCSRCHNFKPSVTRAFCPFNVFICKVMNLILTSPLLSEESQFC